MEGAKLNRLAEINRLSFIHSNDSITIKKEIMPLLFSAAKLEGALH